MNRVKNARKRDLPDPNPAHSLKTRKEALAKETYEIETRRALQKMEDKLQAEQNWIFDRGEADADESERYYRLGPRHSSTSSSSSRSWSKPSTSSEIFLIRAFLGPESSANRVAITDALAAL